MGIRSEFFILVLELIEQFPALKYDAFIWEVKMGITETLMI